MAAPHSRDRRAGLVHFPDGHNETFKVSRRVKLDDMEAGDEVNIRAVDAIALRRAVGNRADHEGRTFERS